MEKSSNLTPIDSLKLTEFETRCENLEKELVKKVNYIKELEDIIVEKEYKISELEKSSDEIDNAGIKSAKTGADELKILEEVKCKL